MGWGWGWSGLRRTALAYCVGCNSVFAAAEIPASSSCSELLSFRKLHKVRRVCWEISANSRAGLQQVGFKSQTRTRDAQPAFSPASVPRRRRNQTLRCITVRRRREIQTLGEKFRQENVSEGRNRSRPAAVWTQRR